MTRLCFLIYLLTACTRTSPEWRAYYAPINDLCLLSTKPMKKSLYFLVVLVDAKHLDYSHGRQFLKTLAKHPNSLDKSGEVGHAWVYVSSPDCYIEGGHSGELGLIQPKYLDGVMDLVDAKDPNPIRYLWAIQKDGFFQRGSGGHKPTFAAKFNLTKEQFDNILARIKAYPYKNYSITKNQCCHFVKEIAALAGIHLEDTTTITIPPFIYFNGDSIPLWTDPCYHLLTIGTPDRLEQELAKLVKQGRAELALTWALKRYKANYKHLIPILTNNQTNWQN